MASLSFILLLVCLSAAVKRMPKVKNIEIKHETHDQIVEWAPDIGDKGVRVSVDVEFDSNELWDHYISILCVNSLDGVIVNDSTGFYFEPRQAKMSYEQALEYRKGGNLNDFDTINYHIGNLFMTGIYTW